ncbi:sulfatase-like hydrolase/transferase [Xinfangfangia sp. CPCC 101601]|uniref:Sulfatase-like hydrolase/transferase n=1 Tax=Pseudogemmobacter lacusdianii TaxID=3069608 RepID=A0ABU0W1A8_9RHOB|nr:sulfatase-like hydrolase/transferase [Xinfangfangia sp. CPCC 101601]MDQ2067754.1 sulfatase-like hydrolase/transferase [Xinfangfangia sp. CPCC 101601]
MSLPLDAPRRPDVVFITVDQWRGDLAPGVPGSFIPTPNLSALAREATSFRSHYTQAYPCGPARAGLLTGLYAHKHRSISNGTPLDRRHRTVFEAARDRGYAPVLFGYTDTTPDPRSLSPRDPARLNYAGVAAGLEVGCLLDEDARPWIAHLMARGYQIDAPQKGRDGVFAQRAFGAPALYGPEDSETAFLTDQVLGHMATAADDPLFLHISYIAPHPPFAATAEWLNRINPKDVPAPRLGPDASPQHPLLDHLLANADLSRFVPGLSGPAAAASAEVMATIRHAYAALAAEVDHHIGRLIAQLKAMGRWENTIFILSGDHGEMLFDRGLLGKVGWFDESAHVPLIFRMPGGAQGHIVEDFTQSIDIFATLVELLGLRDDVNLDGNSLSPFLQGKAPADWRQAAFWSHDFRSLAGQGAGAALKIPPGRCNLQVMRGRDFKYVHSTGLPPLLFDLRDDPDQKLNRIGDPACRDLHMAGLEGLLELRLQHEAEELSAVEASDGQLWDWRAQNRRDLYTLRED